MKSRLLLTSLAASALLVSPVLAATPPSATTPPAAAASTASPAAAAQSANAMQSRASNRSAGAAGLYRSAQEKLRDLHLYNGEISGTRNAAYVSALRRFQREHHLNATGRLDARTRQALGIA